MLGQGTAGKVRMHTHTHTHTHTQHEIHTHTTLAPPIAQVRQAIDLETNEAVAIKILDKALLTTHDMADQIKKEIAVMMLVKQRHVVNLIEVLASRSKVFIVLELVTGGELFDRVVASPASARSHRRYFQPLVTGLEVLPSAGERAGGSVASGAAGVAARDAAGGGGTRGPRSLTPDGRAAAEQGVCHRDAPAGEPAAG